jgi:hypothetical protein
MQAMVGDLVRVHATSSALGVALAGGDVRQAGTAIRKGRDLEDDPPRAPSIWDIDLEASL